MSACAATRIEAVEDSAVGHDWSAPFYASGDRGKSIVADGRGGFLARGWYHRPEASAPAQGPHPTKTAAREAAADALKERVRAKPQPAAEILGDPTGAAAAQKEVAPRGYVRTDIEHSSEAYGLTVSEDGAGLYAPPGSTVVVEPEAPTGAGLAVLYRFGRAEIWDLSHNFVPGSFDVGEGSTVVPMIEAFEPQTGRRGQMDARSIDKAHRIAGVYVPVDLEHARAPEKLPVMATCPEGMGEHYVDNASAYPAIRPGETAIFDPSIRDLRNGGFYVIEWNGGSRSALLARHRPADGNNPDFWFVDPVNRPGSKELLDRRVKRGLAGGMMFASDGPYEAEHLQAKIVGAVVGILVPHRADAGAAAAPADTSVAERDDEESDDVVALAATPFTPLDPNTPCPVPSREDWIEEADVALPSLRLGWLILQQDKARLAQGVRDLDDDEFKNFVSALGRIERNSIQLARLAREAAQRLMIGCALNMVDEGKAGGADGEASSDDPAIIAAPEVGLAEALQERRARADEFLALMQRDGFVPYPADKPRCLMAIEYAVRNEAERLLAIARGEFERRADAYAGCAPNERDQHLSRLRAELRLDELAVVAVGTAGGDHQEIIGGLVTSWRDYAPCMVTPSDGGPECGIADDDEAERLHQQQHAALSLADDLPATLNNLLPKALALSALVVPELRRAGKGRDSYGMDGRLAFDLHAAIAGRAHLGA